MISAYSWPSGDALLMRTARNLLALDVVDGKAALGDAGRGPL